MKFKSSFIFICLLTLMVVLLVVSTTVGAYKISVVDVFSNALSAQDKLILFNIRFPRVIMAILVGASLGAAGALTQSIFHNPLADPGLLGISSGAALGVGVTSLVLSSLGFTINHYTLVTSALLGSFAVGILLFAIMNNKFYISIMHLLLIGLAFNAIAGSLLGFVLYMSNDANLRFLSVWSMGSLSGASWATIITIMPIMVMGCVASVFIGKELNLLAIGQSFAFYSGINVKVMHRIIIFIIAVLVGTGITVAGIIGFVALISPHICRMLFNTSNNVIIVGASMLMGVILLLFSDTLARTLFAPAEVPIGIFTSLIGAPIFIWLITKKIKGV